MQRILVLGAGLVARPLVGYLLEHGFALTQADLEINRAEAMIAGHQNGRAVQLDLSDQEALGCLVSEHDLVVSLAPPPFHHAVARHCLNHARPMVTASYVSEDMMSLDREARSLGVTLLNEIGVDPGIDHMSAMRIIDAVRDQGGRILVFRSYCGGLPAPECNDNPFGYKLSWAPRGVLMASRNEAIYRRHRMRIHTPNERLFRDMHLVHVEGVGDFEAYLNRDSLQYIDLYGLEDVATMYRGTLRNMGWCDCLHNYLKLGLLDLEVRNVRGLTYRDLTAGILGCSTDDDLAAVSARKCCISRNSLPVSNLDWLGMFDDDPLPVSEICPLDALNLRMQARMTYAEGERDMVVMKHVFVAEYGDGSREQLHSQMVDYGIPGGDSSMARTVSLPVAIAARMILEGRITQAGVLRPMTRDIYDPVLMELESLGIACVEETETIEPATRGTGGKKR